MREIIVRRQNNLLSVKSGISGGKWDHAVELAVATLIMMVDIVGVVQLLQASLQSNLNNRVDTTAMVFAQREMDQIINQPLTSATFTASDGRVVDLGVQTASNTLVGNPVIVRARARPLISPQRPSLAQLHLYGPDDSNDPVGAPIT